MGVRGLANLPCRSPEAFSCYNKQRLSSKQGSPPVYLATHERTSAPADQVINNEATSILVREFCKLGMQHPNTRSRSAKRAAAEAMLQGAAPKHQRM